MFLVIWEFTVKEEALQRFLEVYSPEGDWARLFSHDPAFEKTMLVQDPWRAHVYLTMDFWKSHSAYKAFKSKFKEAYEKLDRDCQDMTVAEVCIGSFEGSPG